MIQRIILSLITMSLMLAHAHAHAHDAYARAHASDSSQTSSHSLVSNAPSGSLKIVDDKMRENVNPVPVKYSYEEDYDSSKFRMKIYKLNPKQMAQVIKPSALCQAAKNSKEEFIQAKTASEYIINVLKKAEALNPKDKDYSLTSAHFIWDFYLAFRGFVDVSHAYNQEKASDFLKFLPNGTIVQLSKHCVPNGAVAVMCDGRLFTKRFPNLEKFVLRANDPQNDKCKISNGIRFIVETDRLKALAQ